MKLKATREKMRESTDRDELVKQLKDRKEELFNLRFQMAVGQQKNNAKISEVKKDIARINTILREKELGLR